jgi:hypothetical protein
MPASHPMHAPEAVASFFATPIQVAARALGMAFLVIGVLGVIPGVSVLHNVLHGTFGLVGLLASRTYGSARSYFGWGGAVLFTLTAYGLVVDHDSPTNVSPDAAGSWLHLGFAFGMTAIGVAASRLRGRTVPATRSSRRAPHEPHM